MTTRLFANLVILLTMAFAVMAVTPSFAEAQKKAKAKPKTSVQQEKKEEPEELTSDEQAPPPVQTSPATGSFLSVLKKFIGQKTNIGVLKEVNKDYIITAEDENSTTMIALTQVISLKQIKEEDPPSVRLEIGIAKRD